MSLITTLVALTIAAAPASSPEATFKSAIEDFEFGEHAQAAEKLRSILEPPRLASKEDLIVARQYLGACYHLLGDKTKARAEFSMLLALDPRHKLDPEVFSPALVDFFEATRKEAGIGMDGEPPPPQKKEPPQKTKTELEPLPKVTREPPPAALALIPFGVGQYSNRHPVRGTLFAVTEVGLFATALTSFMMLEGLKMEGGNCPDRGLCVAPADKGKAETLQAVYLGTFWSGLGVVAIGVVEALISYPGDALEE
jgi:hypothetical protein